MLNKEHLEQFAKKYQMDFGNIFREYCQHLFLSFLYQKPNSEKLLFKGGTALRILCRSPRFSEDLDFTGIRITYHEIETLFTHTFADIEKTGIDVEIREAKKTTGGYLGIATFIAYDIKTNISIEISLRTGKSLTGVRTLIQSDYLPPYTLVHMAITALAAEKLDALKYRKKPRDFYDYFFLLSGNYPVVKEKHSLLNVLQLLRTSGLDFRRELRRFLPKSHLQHLKNFPHILEEKIRSFL